MDIDFFVSNGAREEKAVSFLQETFETAAKEGASDIEFAHDLDGVLQVRLYRTGGWVQYSSARAEVAATAVSKLRGRCDASITDAQKERDGNFQQTAAGRTFDIRVNFLPTLNGTCITCRLLDPNKAGLPFTSLGMPPDVEDTFLKLLKRREGAIFAVGPTGSGKTTTLYSGVQLLNQPKNKIITIEDPVEYRLPGLIQVQVGQGTGRTFASSLKAAMRQRPTGIIVGEIRDPETARIAFLAAQSGHILLGTFHANSSTLAPITLKEHGIDAYRIGAAVLAIISQRRVATFCAHCAYPRKPSITDAKFFEMRGFDPVAANMMEVRGCPKCFNTGYGDQTTIFELLRIADFPEAIEAVGDNRALLRAARKQPQFRTLAHEAAGLIHRGLTSFEECSSIFWETEEEDA